MGLLGLLLVPTVSWADDLGSMLGNISQSFPGILGFIFALCVVMGLGFAAAAIFKFKQYKDNPTQITIGQPISLLLLGAALIWTPFIIKVLGATLTGATDDTTLTQDEGNLQSTGTAGFKQWLP
jgi:intracellular multiplication protein IcmD